MTQIALVRMRACRFMLADLRRPDIVFEGDAIRPLCVKVDRIDCLFFLCSDYFVATPLLPGQCV
ncbi:hypothetical protein MA20_37845 [Bradyrhizobium japonicum]|uniref:Uncharacterized protein n=1 Tax=Bradyrhizobium japonicum TaxID=375 RepID=A0A0A3XJJ5_BRAJP|nr:hypothetical protein MA20_37845 [Bradyrhizobium japonicum]